MANHEKWRLKIQGMTCKHCETKVESTLKELIPGADIKVSYGQSEAIILTKNVLPSEEIIKNALAEEGYTLKRVQKITEGQVADNSDSKFSLPQFTGILSVLLLIYLLIDRTIGFNAIPTVEAGASLGVLFMVGVLTSVHCVSMCGGINLSQSIVTELTPLSSNPTVRKYQKMKPSLLYNGGRVVSYTIIGGVVGALGSVISFSGSMRGIIAILTGLFMVVMGLNMLSLFPWLKRFNISMPKFFTQNQKSEKRPFVVGLINGLMPCGPLQAMQLYALGTGSALMGALSMLAFSLGTFPLMFALGAVSTLLSRKFTGTMMKASAMLVILLGVVMAGRGFALGGADVQTVKVDGWQVAEIQNGVQVINTALLSSEYPSIILQKGIPVVWNLEADESNLNGCNNRINLYDYDLMNIPLGVGDNIIEFTPDETGNFSYSCWMGMIGGRIKVVDDLSSVNEDFLQNERTLPGTVAPTGGGCCAP